MASKVIPSKAAIIGYIQAAARKRGIDPAVAVKVAKSEGLNADPNEGWQSTYVKNGKRERSYGPYQLYIDGGLGNSFQKRTGLDPTDPTTVFSQIDFALDHAAKNGWGAWYGAKRVGLGNKAGIGPDAAPRGVSGKAEDFDISLEARDERSIADKLEFADLDMEGSEGGGRPQASLAEALGLSEPTMEFSPLPPMPELPPPIPTVFNEPQPIPFQNIKPTSFVSKHFPQTRLTPPDISIESPQVIKAREMAARVSHFKEELMSLRPPSPNIEDRRMSRFRQGLPKGMSDWSLDPGWQRPR